MSTHTFQYALFQDQFPAYSVAPPESVLSVYFDLATLFVDPNDNWCGGLDGASLDYALNCIVAHYCYINALIAQGQNTAIVTGATIDKVTVNLLAPPVKSNWQYWLSASPYGKQLLALLESIAALGIWSPGLPEGSAFRRVGGGFY